MTLAHLALCLLRIGMLLTALGWEPFSPPVLAPIFAHFPPSVSVPLALAVARLLPASFLVSGPSRLYSPSSFYKVVPSSGPL